MIARWGKANLAQLARLSGLDRGNFYSWQRGIQPEPSKVGEIAEALGANPIDAFIAAGYFTHEQFDAYRSAGVERAVSNEALAAAVLSRMNAATRAAGTNSGADVADDLAPNRSVDTAQEQERPDNRHGAGEAPPAATGS